MAAIVAFVAMGSVQCHFLWIKFDVCSIKLSQFTRFLPLPSLLFSFMQTFYKKRVSLYGPISMVSCLMRAISIVAISAESIFS